MRPTLAFVAGQLSGGGAERQLLYLLEGLAAYPVRLTLANLNPGDPGEKAVAALGIPIEPIPRSRWKVDRIARLARWLRREQPVLVHSWSFFGNTYTAWAGALARVPVRLGCLRGDAFYDFVRPGGKPPLFMRLGLEAPHAVVANSAAAAAAIEAHGLRRARMRAVPNGLDLAALRAAAFGEGGTGGWGEGERGRGGDGETGRPGEKSSLVPPSPRPPLSPSPPRPVLALVGSMIPRKNVPMFLRVMAGLKVRHPEIEGWLIGDGPDRGSLEALAREMGLLDCVRFLGQQTNVPRLITRADILCHCAHSEGLANAIMEASALGLPVVTTRCGGAAEIVEHGVTGFLVDRDDHEGMIRCVECLLADPALRTHMGEAGLRKMEREFSVERMVREMVSVYREALAEAGDQAFRRSGVQVFRRSGVRAFRCSGPTLADPNDPSDRSDLSA